MGQISFFNKHPYRVADYWRFCEWRSHEDFYSEWKIESKKETSSCFLFAFIHSPNKNFVWQKLVRHIFCGYWIRRKSGCIQILIFVFAFKIRMWYSSFCRAEKSKKFFLFLLLLFFCSLRVPFNQYKRFTAENELWRIFALNEMIGITK